MKKYSKIVEQFKNLGERVVQEAFKVGELEGSYITNEFVHGMRAFRHGIEAIDAIEMLEICLHVENDIFIYETQKKPVKALKKAFSDMEKYVHTYLKQKHDLKV